MVWASSPQVAFVAPLGVFITCSLFLRSKSKAENAQGRWMRQMVGGSPKYTWCLGAACQCFLFPIVLFASFVSFGGSSNMWLFAQWASDESSIYCTWFHCIILAYFCKDFLFPLDAMLWGHHIVCGLAVWLSLSGFLEGGHNAFALGTLLMEFGSGANSWMRILSKPSRPAIDAYFMVMTLSNISSVTCCIYWAAASEGTSAVTRILFIALATPVAALRQLDAFSFHKELTRSAAEDAKVTN
eukprot:TRINITY_DN63021_c0_g1_i1.p1 TRINITY_DN63021_c0_g1~~TRINITY_DN63021_c0_g1_i1.p1  ORF type:complete len:242 (-),score=37.99 TRINITY_DN63021_c0_g1_i1:277-1002(-)